MSVRKVGRLEFIYQTLLFKKFYPDYHRSPRLLYLPLLEIWWWSGTEVSTVLKCGTWYYLLWLSRLLGMQWMLLVSWFCMQYMYILLLSSSSLMQTCYSFWSNIHETTTSKEIHFNLLRSSMLCPWRRIHMDKQAYINSLQPHVKCSS